MKGLIQKHIQTCHKCQRKDKKPGTSLPLQPLPQCNAPNQRIHVDLFGQLKSSENGNKFILVITDAFTKLAEVIPIPNKEAETVSRSIYNEWFCRYGIPQQIHSDGGKEFINRVATELYKALDIQQTKTSAYHPQCNAQAEVLTKPLPNT